MVRRGGFISIVAVAVIVVRKIARTGGARFFSPYACCVCVVHVMNVVLGIENGTILFDYTFCCSGITVWQGREFAISSAHHMCVCRNICFAR